MGTRVEPRMVQVGRESSHLFRTEQPETGTMTLLGQWLASLFGKKAPHEQEPTLTQFEDMLRGPRGSQRERAFKGDL